MDDSEANQIKAELDSALSHVGANVCILFGTTLFNEFRKRGWLTLEKFGASGTSLLEREVLAFGRTHMAISTLDVPENEFRVDGHA